MKKIYFVSQIILFFAIITSFQSCNKDVNLDLDNDRGGVSIIPNPAEIGQKISINGYNFRDANSVKFPGEITVSDFEKVGEHQLDIEVPPGTITGGNIVVELSGSEFTIPIEFKLLTPKVTQTYPLSGATDVGPDEVLVIVGEDLINVSEIIFPGKSLISVGEMSFLRKGNEEIRLLVPAGVLSGEGFMTLKTKYGYEFESTSVMFSGGGYVPEEYQWLTGEDGSGKTWTWDESREDGVLFGSGAYQRDVWPTWWPLRADNIHQGVGRSNSIGAKMTFSYSSLGSTMTKQLVDGTLFEGNFELDMTVTKANLSDGSPWSVGMLKVTGGDPELSILGGADVKEFDILVINENELVLSADLGGTGYFFFFGAVDD